jgi:hypothetical protein
MASSLSTISSTFVGSSSGAAPTAPASSAHTEAVVAGAGGVGADQGSATELAGQLAEPTGQLAELTGQLVETTGQTVELTSQTVAMELTGQMAGAAEEAAHQTATASQPMASTAADIDIAFISVDSSRKFPFFTH